MTKWRVALLFNLKHPATAGADAAPDALAEFAIPETVQCIESALRVAGHEVIPLEADAALLDTIRQINPDICFNIARGIDGRNRLAHIPALLEMLNIPFTGSDVQGQTLARDKAVAKRIWQTHDLPVAPGQVFGRADEPLSAELKKFPLFVKPLHEGSGTGVDDESIVGDEEELRARVQWVITNYQQPALVETYLPGREFAVGILGNSSVATGQHTSHNGRYGAHVLPILEIDTLRGNPRVYGASARLRRPGANDAPRYTCPANLPLALEAELRTLALSAFNAVGAFDMARVDIRLNEHEEPHLLEIDTMPNLDPHLSDFCFMAEADGMSYAELINQILSFTMARNFLRENPFLREVCQE